MWKSHRRAFAVIAILTAIGCAGGDDGSGPTGSISLTASPSALTLLQGASGTVTVTLVRGGGFVDPVNVAVSGLPAGVTLSVTPVQLTGATTQATVTVNVANTVPAGTYTATVTATATGIGSATASYTLTVTAPVTPTFVLTATPAALSLAQGSSGTTTIGVQRTNLSTPIALTLENPPSGVTGSFNPASVTGDQSVLTINVASTVAPGSYTLTVSGHATGPDRTTTIALTVLPPPNYQLSTTPNTLSIAAGATGTTTVNIARTNFTGAVTLALDAPPAGITATFNPAAPTGNSSTATISVDASVAAGDYNVTIKGTATGVPGFTVAGQIDEAAAAGDRTTTVAVSVTPAGNFTITAAPTSLSIGVGASGNTSVTIVRTSFTADIALSLSSPPPGITGVFTPPTLTGSTLTSTLVISVAANVTLGSRTITVQGAGGSLTKITAITLIVTAAATDFTMSATPASLSIGAGANGNTSLSIVRTNFTSDVALSLVSPPAGITGVFTPATLTGATLTSDLVISVAASVAPANYTVTVQGAGGSVTKTTTVIVTVPGGAASVTLSMTPNALTIQQGGSGQATLNAARTNYTGNITPSYSGNPAGLTLTFNPNPITLNSATVTVNVGGSTPVGTHNLTITGASGAAGNPTTTLAVTVTAPSGGSSFDWDFCTADGVPLKFWRQSGGTWADVAPQVVGNITRFSFNISSTSGGVAYTMQASSFSLFNSTRVSQRRSKLREANRTARERTSLARSARLGMANQVLPLNATFFDTFVQLALTSELGAYRETCAPSPPTLVSKTFNVTGIGGAETGTLGYGGASAALSSTTPSYNLMVQPGNYDWLAAFGPSPGPDWTSYRIGRNEATPGAAVNINRVGATAFTTFPFTVSGGAGGSFWQYIQGFQGSRGFIHVLSIGSILSNTNTGTMRFLAPTDRLGTDLVSLQITNLEQGATSFDFRISDNYIGSAPPASGSFALPPAVPSFTVSPVMGAPVPTWSVTGQTPAAYQTSVSSITTSFEGGDGNALYTISATRAYQTANGMATSYTLAGPTLPNFQAAWAPTAPIAESTVVMFGYDLLGVPTAGTVAIFALRIQ